MPVKIFCGRVPLSKYPLTPAWSMLMTLCSSRRTVRASMRARGQTEWMPVAARVPPPGMFISSSAMSGCMASAISMADRAFAAVADTTIPGCPLINAERLDLTSSLSSTTSTVREL